MSIARRATLRVAGTVAITAAVSQMATGARGVLGFDWRVATDHLPAVSLASLDSELCFYAAWYAVAGWLMHRAANDEALDRAVRPLIAAGWGTAALSRVLSVRRAGRPDPLFLALGGAEVALPAVLATSQ